MGTIEDLIELTKARSRPCLRFAASIAPSTTYLGGNPTLPPNVEWPSWKGRPLSFLVQIDLGSAPKDFWADWLPREGLLLFFYDAEQSTGGYDPADRRSWRVVYVEPGVPIAERDEPGSIPKGQFPRQDIALYPEQSFPSLDRLDFDTSDITEEELDEYFENGIGAEPDDGPLHQLFGWPGPIQNDTMEEECQLAANGFPAFARASELKDQLAAELNAGAVEWELLLQVDSDDEVEMMWGDVGRLYFWVRPHDARRGDFSNVWMILQCH